LKAFKKEFACNGSIVDDEEMGKVIQLQGDQRQKILEILIEEGIEKETIKLVFIFLSQLTDCIGLN
jgi:translation initiation factor 1